MKHFISWCLIIALLCQTIVLVDAEETNPSNPNYSLGLQSYVGSDDDIYLRTNANYGYWRFIEDYESDIVAMEILNSIDVLIGCGTQPSVQKYTEVLVNIIATYDHDNASDIAEQRKNDNMKSALDYAMDITKIGADAIGLMTDMDKSTSDLEKWIVKAISGLSVLEGNIDNWLDALSDLEALVQNYSKYDLFLELIEKEAKGDLKTAAATLRTSMEKAMQLRLNTYNTILNDNFDNYTEFFFNDVFFDTLKLTNEYDNDVNFKTLVDCGSDFADKVKEYLNLNKAWDLGLAIGTLVGNVAVGGEDLINRLHELMALRDIGDVLCNALEEDESLYTIGKYDEAVGEHFFILSEYLTGCRLRGEYCLYSIVAADAGLLSRFSIEEANDAYNWYINRSSLIIGIMHAMDTACEAILVPISDPNYEIGEVSEWYIYDENGALCSNYTLRITGKEKMHIGAIETDFVEPIEYSVTKPEPLSLELEAGYWYSVEIVDDINKDNSLFFTVAVNDSSDGLIELIEIETDFTAAYEDSFSSEKKLTSIVTYQDNKKAEEYHFSYNDSGLVVELVAYRYEGGDAIEWYTENYEYDSNSNLVLVNHGSSQERYQYDYDANGQIKGYSFAWYVGEILSPESDSYILSYDNQGRIIEKRNEYGSDIQEYSYDESGNAVYAIREYSWADGHFLDKTTYDCTYAPLIIQSRTSESAEYGNSCGKSISFMPHWNLTVASGTISDSCSFDVDSSGYLLRVIDKNGDNVYVCNYQEVINEDSSSDFPSSSSADQLVAATYISAIERVASNDLCSNVCGFLFDLDGDKTEELVLYYGLREEYYAIPIHAFDVYDVENGQLVTRLEKIDIGSADVGGSNGNIGIEYHNGAPVIATYARNGWSSPGYYVFDANYEIKLYDCHTYSSIRSISVNVDEHDNGYTITHIIDGTELSENSFHQEIAQYKRIFLDNFDSYSYVSWNYKTTGESFEQKLTAYDLLRYLQQTAKIAPESPPVLMQDDAEEIAYSIWGEYLERTQGFDWKIFEEHSIIKNGIEYYCYTLNTNSRYGEEDWSIHNYLFINSVTGEYDHSLF